MVKVVFVVGTTASGKSDWALNWAKTHNGVIVNCDSIQLYKDLDIGSAKPSLEERQIVPHYLYDYVQAPDVMTAGRYRDDFFALLNKLEQELPSGTPVFVVGGTGFYFQALEKGMYETPDVPAVIRNQVQFEIQQAGGTDTLWRELNEADPEAATKIKPQDRYRIERGVELLRCLKSDPKTAHLNITSLRAEFEQNQKPFPYPLLKVGPTWDRDVLRSRIEIRVERMLNAGLLDEVRVLIEKGFREWSPLESVGYKEAVEFLETNQTKEWLIEQIVIHTYQLAKRQRTWFQRDADINWFDAALGPGPATKLIEEFLLK